MPVRPRPSPRRRSAPARLRAGAALTALAVASVLATAGCGGPDAAEAAATPSGDPGQVAELPQFDPETAVGEYAQGFPADLLATPEGATLLATSAQPVADSTPPMTQITMNLSSTLGTQEVLDQLGGILAGQGFGEVESPEATGLTGQAAWTRQTATDAGTAQEALLLGVIDDGERRLVSISGSVAVAASS